MGYKDGKDGEWWRSILHIVMHRAGHVQLEL